MARPKERRLLPEQAIGRVGAIPKFTPPRDRRVDTRSVACPSCDVAAGEPCRNAQQQPMRTCHVGRRRMALRMGL